MTIEQLRKYRNNIETLESIHRLLEDKKVVTCVQASTGPPSFEKVTRSEEGYLHGMGSAELLTKKKQLENENDFISKFIKSIPKRRVYDALNLYCLDEKLKDPSWQSVADILGELDGQTLARAVRRYLKNFKNVR